MKHLKYTLIIALAIVVGCNKEEPQPEKTCGTGQEWSDQYQMCISKSAASGNCPVSTYIGSSLLESSEWEVISYRSVEWANEATSTSYTIEDNSLHSGAICDIQEKQIYSAGTFRTTITPDSICGIKASGIVFKYQILDCAAFDNIPSSNYYYDYYSRPEIQERYWTLGAERIIRYWDTDPDVDPENYDAYYGIKYVDNDEVELIYAANAIVRIRKI